MLPRLPLSAVKPGGNALVEDLIDQGTLSGTGNPGYQSQRSQRESHIDILKIVFLCAHDLKASSVPFAPFRGYGDIFLACKILPRDRFLCRHDILRRSLGYHIAAVRSGSRDDIDDMIGGIHRILVMLHHDERVP